MNSVIRVTSHCHKGDRRLVESDGTLVVEGSGPVIVNISMIRSVLNRTHLKWFTDPLLLRDSGNRHHRNVKSNYSDKG